MTRPIPSAAIWALGATQIIGYGTLYYSFGVLAPAIGQAFGWSQQWVYGALSLALLSGGLAAPAAGHLMDRYGAAKMMTIGSILVGIPLVAAAWSPNGWIFVSALIAMEVISTLTLYAAAFAALVQLGGRDAQRSITLLTLIAGFASTLFWPLTAGLLSVIDWRAVYLVFAAVNLAICVPLQWWLSCLPVGPSSDTDHPIEPMSVPRAGTAALPPMVFTLLLAGFAIEGFILSAILMHIAPMLTSLQLGASSIFITTLFGPAQVLSRLINMVFGQSLRQTHLGIIAAVLPPLGILVLVLTSPMAFGGILFAILFGLGSGLTSIVSGSLPLELFGRKRYGARLGWLSSARQIASAIAPFLLALVMAGSGVPSALLAVVALGFLSVAIFTSVAWVSRRSATKLVTP